MISGRISFLTFSWAAGLAGLFTLAGATALDGVAALAGAGTLVVTDALTANEDLSEDLPEDLAEILAEVLAEATGALAFTSAFEGAAAFAIGFAEVAGLGACADLPFADALEVAEPAFVSRVFDFESAFAAAFLANGANLTFTDGRAVFFLVATTSTPNT